MLVFFNRDEIEKLKMLVFYLYDSANEDQDPDLWMDTEWFHHKIRDAMKTYGRVVNDDMSGN